MSVSSFRGGNESPYFIGIAGRWQRGQRCDARRLAEAWRTGQAPATPEAGSPCKLFEAAYTPSPGTSSRIVDAVPTSGGAFPDPGESRSMVQRGRSWGLALLAAGM